MARETLTIPTSAQAARDGETGIVITASHVYLPLDDEGNGRVDWASTSDETAKVERRARLKVPRDLAEFLSKRDQAELL